MIFLESADFVHKQALHATAWLALRESSGYVITLQLDVGESFGNNARAEREREPGDKARFLLLHMLVTKLSSSTKMPGL